MEQTQSQMPAVIESPPRATAVEPRTVDDFLRLATIVHKSGLAPESLKSPEAVFIALAHGAELGLKPMQSLRMVNVIKNRPGLSADGIVAVCLASGVCEYFESVEESAEHVVWRTKRRGRNEKRHGFTMADAKAAGLTSSPMYQKFPSRMLSARCKSFLGRDVYPDIVGGLLSTEELESLPESPREPQVEATSAPVVIPEPAQGPAPGTEAQIQRYMILRRTLGLSADRGPIIRELSVRLRRTIGSRDDVTFDEWEAINADLAAVQASEREPGEEAATPVGETR